MVKQRREKTEFVCESCGTTSPRWLGRCPGCGAWNTLTERRARRADKGGGTRARPANKQAHVKALPVSEIVAEGTDRRGSGIAELDRVLGGGLVPGAVILLGGDPGIGKSTLLTQALVGVTRTDRDAVCLYASGEESAEQIALRARRLGFTSDARVHVLATTQLDDVLEALEQLNPLAAVIDSVQTIRSDALDSAAGTVAQIREVADRLISLAKERGISLFLIGHVTKEGQLAGPKVLEHLVDTVLSFEGDRTGGFRLLRARKNRFGSAQELGVFEMIEEGLREVRDPSAAMLAERPQDAAGSVVTPIAEGSRPLMVEVQALVAPAVYGSARRIVTGLDANRMGILLAVLDRKADVHILDMDVFASITGGARVEERALDLPLALAVYSSVRDKAIPESLTAFGEIGLAGELRAVPRAESRIAEAAKMGYTRVLLPAASVARLEGRVDKAVELIGAATLTDALAALRS